MKRCKHENADHLMPGDISTSGYRLVTQAIVEQLRCLDCGAWLPLGPANDSPEAVAIEIRAAEIAVNVAEMTEWWLMHSTVLDERHGWRDFNDDGGDCPCSVGRYWPAGYLARCIATHTDEDR